MTPDTFVHFLVQLMSRLMLQTCHLWILVACTTAIPAFADDGTVGRIEIVNERSVPTVTIECSGRSFEFYLSFESSGLGVFSDTVSGKHFIESQSARDRTEEGATTMFKKRVTIGGKPLDTSHFGIATVPTQLEELRKCAGVIGLNVITQPVVIFDLTEQTIALADDSVPKQDTSTARRNVLRLHHGSTGKLSTLLNVNDRDWAFDLSTSIRKRKSEGVTCCTELLRSVDQSREIETIPDLLLPSLKALLVDGQHDQPSSHDDSNSINFLRIGGGLADLRTFDEIEIDRNSMKAYFR